MSVKKINAHSHLLPEPSQIPTFMKDKKLFWIDEDKKYMRQGEWSRPITDPSFFVDEKLIWMEKNNIDHAVVITLSQLYGNGLNERDVNDMIRFQNDFQAHLQETYSDKFTCGFVVQPRFMDQALREVERCVVEKGLRVLCLPTHFQDDSGQWKTISHLSVMPLFELANHYNLAIEIHPYDGQKFIQLADQSWRFHLIWMLAQTADALHFYALNGLADRFPNIRTCFAHGCMLGQASFGRRMQGFEGRPDLFKGQSSPERSNAHPNIFFDTLVHDPLTLKLLIDRVGTSQIVWGLDDPYPLGEMEGVGDSYPGKLLDDAINANILNKAEQKQIYHDNVLRWLGKM